MKTAILLCICLVVILSYGFSQGKTEKQTTTTSTTNATVNSEPISLYCLTKCKADTLIFGEKQIEFSNVYADSLINNPCLVLRGNKQFSFYYNNVTKIDSVKNSVTGLYEQRILSAYKELTGNYESDIELKKTLRLDFKNGTTRIYSITNKGDKTLLASNIDFMK